MSHGKLDRVGLGNFYRNEVAFLGTTCEKMEHIFDSLNAILSKNKLIYIDGDHSETNEQSSSRLVIGTTEVNCKSNSNWSKYDFEFALNTFDVAIVNGNHFQASKQIVFCDESKRGSLERRAKELTDVRAIYMFEGLSEIPDYIKTLVPNFLTLPILRNNTELAMWIQKTILVPPFLEALILAGGRSVRMGEDKSKIEYHGIPQWKYLSMCFEDLDIPVNISCREDQQSEFTREGVNLIIDRVSDVGPIGGLMSAFMKDSSKAYLTVACDLPYVNSKFLFELISQRDTSCLATAFSNSEKGWPEPLISIWEPRSFLRIMQFVGVGNTCPRKVLMNSPIKLIEPSDQKFLINANSPEDRNRIIFSK